MEGLRQQCGDTKRKLETAEMQRKQCGKTSADIARIKCGPAADETSECASGHHTTCAIRKAIRAGVGFGSGSETTRFLTSSVYG